MFAPVFICDVSLRFAVVGSALQVGRRRRDKHFLFDFDRAGIVL
jgi:hypothetical protein